MREGIAIVLLLTIASATGAFAEPSGILTEPVVALSGSRWSLMRAEPSTAALSYGVRTTLEFSATHVRVQSGCTRGKAPYRVVNGTLLLGGIRTTHRACTSGQGFDSALLAALSARPALQQTSTELVLVSASGQLVFRAEPGPSAQAVSKVIYVAAARKSCMGNVPAMCLQTRTKATDPWGLFYDEIVDFTPQPGVEYRLRVLQDPVRNPPMDAPSTREYLDAILSERVVDQP
jgi:heat shock protein HslJ